MRHSEESLPGKRRPPCKYASPSQGATVEPRWGSDQFSLERGILEVLPTRGVESEQDCGLPTDEWSWARGGAGGEMRVEREGGEACSRVSHLSKGREEWNSQASSKHCKGFDGTGVWGVRWGYRRGKTRKGGRVKPWMPTEKLGFSSYKVTKSL